MHPTIIGTNVPSCLPLAILYHVSLLISMAMSRALFVVKGEERGFRDIKQNIQTERVTKRRDQRVPGIAPGFHEVAPTGTGASVKLLFFFAGTNIIIGPPPIVSLVNRGRKLRRSTKFLLAQFLWIVPYLFFANYLERALLTFRLLCYTEPDLLSVQRSVRMDTDRCLHYFFANHPALRQAHCLLNSPSEILLRPTLKRFDVNNRVLVVRSAPRHNTYRNYIRKSWKKEMEPDIPVIFVSGRDEYNDSDLRKESDEFDDILQLDFIDSYRNLTLKMMNIYRYFLDSTNISQIVVINDDTIVNATALKTTLREVQLQYQSSSYIVGKVSRGYPRLIFPWLPWYVSADEYPHRCYPPFVQGSSFVISASAARDILNRICDFPFIHLDDIMMGVVTNCLQIRNIHRSGFDHYIPNDFVVFHYQYSRYTAERLYKNLLNQKAISPKILKSNQIIISAL
ncbi:galactosyltransferase domain-containing protein [Ditylenchus destructor]|uniref:Hexosyltransferase n=1 Tax=Ditylenchus destructor TaxID=166010 RepID=A0AAD4R837_9BILA|nr:galactosyltransferase domain-containing protein [Ditylenchus destructor]